MSVREESPGDKFPVDSFPADEFAVIRILIVDDRVTVDNVPIQHNGTLPLAQVALEALMANPSRAQGRPMMAMATDETGTSMFVVDEDGLARDVIRLSEGQSTHFPEVQPAAAATALPHPAATGLRSRVASGRLRIFSIAAVTTVALVATATAVVNSGSTNPSPLIEPKTTRAASAPSETPIPSLEATPAPEVLPTITAIARQQPGGPLRLTISTSLAPLSVRVVLLAPNGSEQAQRTVMILRDAVNGKASTVVTFADLAPRKYQWLVSTVDAPDASGVVEIRAAVPPPSSAPEPTIAPPTESNPAAAEAPSQPTRRPPSGPRDNNPIAPTPQP